MNCKICGSTLNKSGYCSGDRIEEWSQGEMRKVGGTLEHCIPWERKRFAELLHFGKREQ